MSTYIFRKYYMVFLLGVFEFDIKRIHLTSTRSTNIEKSILESIIVIMTSSGLICNDFFDIP